MLDVWNQIPARRRQCCRMRWWSRCATRGRACPAQSHRDIRGQARQARHVHSDIGGSALASHLSRNCARRLAGRVASGTMKRTLLSAMSTHVIMAMALVAMALTATPPVAVARVRASGLRCQLMCLVLGHLHRPTAGAVIIQWAPSSHSFRRRHAHRSTGAGTRSEQGARASVPLAAVGRTALPAPWSDPASSRPIRAQQLRVLLAEDTDIVREILTHRLQQAGCDDAGSRRRGSARHPDGRGRRLRLCASGYAHAAGHDGLEVVRGCAPTKSAIMRLSAGHPLALSPLPVPTHCSPR